MGFWRGLGKVFGSLVFTTFLVLGILLVGIIEITGHDSIKQIASGMIEKQLLSSNTAIDLQDVRNFLLFQCTQTDKTTLTLSDKLPQIILDCNDVRNSDSSKLPSLISGAIVDSMYYRNFGCNFSNLVQCSQSPENTLQGVPIFFVSNEANQLYKTATTYVWVLAAVGLLILLVSIETLPGRFQGVGWNLAITSLPVLVLSKVQSLVPSGSQEVSDAVKPVIDSFISSTTKLFLIAFVIGAICLVVGYGMKFYQSKKQNKKKK